MWHKKAGLNQLEGRRGVRRTHRCGKPDASRRQNAERSQRPARSQCPQPRPQWFRAMSRTQQSCKEVVGPLDLDSSGTCQRPKGQSHEDCAESAGRPPAPGPLQQDARDRPEKEHPRDAMALQQQAGCDEGSVDAGDAVVSHRRQWNCRGARGSGQRPGKQLVSWKPWIAQRGWPKRSTVRQSVC